MDTTAGNRHSATDAAPYGSVGDNHVARFTETLRVAQWASPRQLAELQHGLLERLLRHAAAQTQAYAGRLRPVLSKGGLDLERWNEIPTLSRTDLQDRQQDFHARTTPPEVGRVVTYATSGSTGRPLEFLKNTMLTGAARAVVERAHDWAGANRDLPYATIAIDRRGNAPPPDGHFRRGWSWMGGRGRHGFLAIEAPLKVQAAFLNRHRPAYLKTYPTNAAALAEEAAGEPWREHIQHVFTFAETLTDHHVDLIRDRLGVEVTDCYASEEAGQLATRCPYSGMYHVAAEAALVEVLREDGTACDPGEIGRVVVTPFYNYAMPLVRYDQGDYAELADRPCACGRVLPTIRRIMGRSRDMFVLASGDRIWPRMSVPEMRVLLPAAAWQAIQHEVDLIEFKYVDDGSGRKPDVAGFEAFMQARYGQDVQIRLTRQDDIPRAPGGKFREFISHVA